MILSRRNIFPTNRPHKTRFRSNLIKFGTRYPEASVKMHKSRPYRPYAKYFVSIIISCNSYVRRLWIGANARWKLKRFHQCIIDNFRWIGSLGFRVTSNKRREPQSPPPTPLVRWELVRWESWSGGLQPVRWKAKGLMKYSAKPSSPFNHFAVLLVVDWTYWTFEHIEHRTFRACWTYWTFSRTVESEQLRFTAYIVWGTVPRVLQRKIDCCHRSTNHTDLFPPITLSCRVKFTKRNKKRTV